MSRGGGCYRETRHVIDLAGAEAAHGLTPGLPSALVVLDGQIAGRWRRTIRATEVEVDGVAYRPFDDAEMQACVPNPPGTPLRWTARRC